MGIIRALSFASCMSCPSAMHDSKGFECLLDEKDEGKDWFCQGG